jgi:hypothetical protein
MVFGGESGHVAGLSSARDPRQGVAVASAYRFTRNGQFAVVLGVPRSHGTMPPVMPIVRHERQVLRMNKSCSCIQLGEKSRSGRPCDQACV